MERLAHSADLRSRLRHVSSAPSAAYSTGCSRVVTHPGTNPARRCLTSVIWREPVCHRRLAVGTWWHFCEVLKLFALWFSADSRMQKLNSDKFDQWRIRRRMWSNMYSRLFSHKVTTRRFCPSYLDAGRRIKDSGPSVDTYIYIYIHIHSGGTLLDFLQNVSRQKAIFREDLLWRSLFGEKHFVRSLKAFHHCVSSSECWALFRVENLHLSIYILTESLVNTWLWGSPRVSAPCQGKERLVLLLPWGWAHTHEDKLFQRVQTCTAFFLFLEVKYGGKLYGECVGVLYDSRGSVCVRRRECWVCMCVCVSLWCVSQRQPEPRPNYEGAM